MNKNLFKSQSINPQQADTVNDAGGKAYALSDKAALAQYAMTGTFGATYYVDAEMQLNRLIELTENVSSKFIAKLAVYSREKGMMKDVPAFLCAILSDKDASILKNIFPKVIDNGRMLRNFVQVVRSGKAGRKSFGTSVKKMIQRWFDTRSDYALFRDSVGNDPSIADVIKMVHPCPKNPTREALYAYLIGKTVVYKKSEMKKNEQGRYETVLFDNLPEIVQKYEKYKQNVLAGKDAGSPPDVEFRLLTALNLKDSDWTEIARNAPWQMTRMNLATFARHNVFKDTSMVNVIAERLVNAEQIKKSNVFPYQLLVAYKNTENIPVKISNALQDALEIATENIPKFNSEKIVVLVDTSGSMGSSVTGNRGSITSKVSCVDVAGLFASAILRKNENAQVLLFDTSVYKTKLNPRDSVMTNAQKCAKGGGGTNVGQALEYVANNYKDTELVIIISDNESWMDTSYSRSTESQNQWGRILKNNSKAKLVCLDIVPNKTTQVKESKNVLNVGGFNDSVFNIINLFVNNEIAGEHFVGEIEKLQIDNVEPQTEIVNIIKSAAKKAIKKSKTKK